MAGEGLKIRSRGANQPVPRSSLGEQKVRPGRVPLDLSAELRDVDMEVVGLPAVGGPPNLAQDRRMGEQLSLVAHEQLEELIFRRGERDGLTVELDQTPLEVDDEPAQIDDRLRRAVDPA